MRIERAVNYITTLGPGKRLCIWVNGCKKHCEGCVSERLRIPDPETDEDIYEYFKDYNLSAIDGVTVSGGEPFDQKDELLALVRYLKERGVSDILVYTGYTAEELIRMKDPSVDGILSEISVLIDGPYVKELDRGVSNIKGSDNQRVIYLDPRVKEKYENYIEDTRRPSEMILGNTHLAVGIPDKEFIDNFKK